MIGTAKLMRRDDCVPDGRVGQPVGEAEFPLDDRGMWREIRTPYAGAAARPALFVDRDGTLIELVNYLSMPEGVRPIAEAVALTARAREHNIPTVMVTLICM